MHEYFPLLVIGAIVGVLSAAFLIAYFTVKNKTHESEFERKMTDGAILKRLLRYAKPYKLNFVAVFFLMGIAIAYEIASPLIMGQIEETIKVDGFAVSDLVSQVILYASIVIVSLAAMYCQTMILQRTGQKIISALRKETFEHIESLSHSQLSETPVGTFVTRVTNDVDGISLAFTNILAELLKNMFILLGITIAMLIINYVLALTVLCFVPFIVLFTFLFRFFSRKAHRKVKNANTDINIFLSEHLSGIKVVQTYNKEEKKREEFEVKNRALEKARREQMFVFGVFRPVIYVLYISSVLLLVFLCAKGYLDGAQILGKAVNGGTLVTFYMYVSKFFNPVQTLAEQFNRLQSAFASAEKIFFILDTAPIVVDDENAVELTDVKGEIEFKDVWFYYKKDEWVLKGVSFKVPAGNTVAFVGATGSGKTTIMSLLCRNYDIQKGEILLDGVNIRRYTVSSLRRHFGQMLQDVFLFSGTIRSNITLGEDFTEEQIEQSCKFVNADSFIDKLPARLDEEVRERGNNFSAGQRQLISFARAVIHKPEVMILDEATANIDTETEVIIQDSLEKMMTIGTMLVVAHRLSTIQKADDIIVLSHGKIVEEGTHNELLKMRGRYYKLYTLQ